MASAFFRSKTLHSEVRADGRLLPRHRTGPTLMIVLGVLAAAASTPAAADERAAGVTAALQVVGDGIPEPIAGAQGDAERGRALLVERAAANCLLCHAAPEPSLRVAGNVGPSLDGIGHRLSAAQLRLRIADIQRVNPASAMPSYYRVDGLDRVASQYRGRPILDARQVEDLVAYLGTLK